jgi:hypothetical protein
MEAKEISPVALLASFNKAHQGHLKTLSAALVDIVPYPVGQGHGQICGINSPDNYSGATSRPTRLAATTQHDETDITPLCRGPAASPMDHSRWGRAASPDHTRRPERARLGTDPRRGDHIDNLKRPAAALLEPRGSAQPARGGAAGIPDHDPGAITLQAAGHQDLAAGAVQDGVGETTP